MRSYIEPTDATPFFRGKVRSTYLTNWRGYLYQVAEDRVSTHNVQHLSPIPGKGEVLTMLTIFWLTKVLAHLPHHLVFWGADIYKMVPEELRKQYPELHYRTVVVEQLAMVPVEFVFRRYLAGSLWRHYGAGSDPYGLELPPKLQLMTRFDAWVFTPTDKSATDEPLDHKAVAAEHPEALELVLEAIHTVERFLRQCGITLVDTKDEVGWTTDGEVLLADELFTPDSSRFAETNDITEGRAPAWLDKQILRDEAEGRWGQGRRVPLNFSAEAVARTAYIYDMLLERITGKTRHAWRAELDQGGS